MRQLPYGDLIVTTVSINAMLKPISRTSKVPDKIVRPRTTTGCWLANLTLGPVVTVYTGLGICIQAGLFFLLSCLQ